MVVIHQILVTSKENNVLNNHWADWSQISYGDSLSWGKEISYKYSWSHDHEGCYGPNGKNYKKIFYSGTKRPMVLVFGI